jgi:hypothetical protein
MKERTGSKGLATESIGMCQGLGLKGKGSRV